MGEQWNSQETYILDSALLEFHGFEHVTQIHWALISFMKKEIEETIPFASIILRWLY